LHIDQKSLACAVCAAWRRSAATQLKSRLAAGVCLYKTPHEDDDPKLSGIKPWGRLTAALRSKATTLLG